VVFLGALLLIVSADWLFWGYAAGISLVVFGVLLAAAFVAASLATLNRRQVAQAFGVLAFAVLPVIELMQTLSVIFLVAGLIALALIATGRLGLEILGNLRSILTFPFKGMGRFVEDIEATVARFVPMLRSRNGVLSAWGMPIVLGAVFLVLFAVANPVIEGWADMLLEVDLRIDEPWRVLFWIAVMVGVWPFLRIAVRTWPTRRRSEVKFDVPRDRTNSIVSHASVTNALVLFNVMFAVQTLLDGAYLWGGADLPDGMTYATYAHRGAYPLVVTAIMAGAFVIVATSMLRPTPLMHRLIFLFVGQNILLLVSSVLRLNLYVSVYALTHLRVAAFIWMGLLTVDFALIIAGLVFRKSNRWLFTWNAATATVVLYLCCFVNFADVIARYNIGHTWPMIWDGRLLDDDYVCGLGPHALPAIHKYEAVNGAFPCLNSGWYTTALVYRAPKTWRGWGVRDWRLEQYLDARKDVQRLGPTDGG
jgi:hypothetical protein